MRALKINGITILIVIFATQNLFAQQFNLNNSKSEISIFGTSSLHDWEEVVQEHSGILELNSEGQMVIRNLKVSIVAESIKSYKSAMDKNTYKALNTDTYKTINFQIIESKQINALGNSKYKVSISGKLSIAGITKTIDLSFTMKVTANTVILDGEKTFNMTDYGIKPPKALFGTITTGDEVTIKFKSVFTN